MSKIALVHGYGAGISPSKKPLSLDLGFAGFYEGLISKEVTMFSWYQHESHSLLNFLNFNYHHQAYLREKEAAQSDEILGSFKQYLQREKPETVVCHSMGAYLFINYMKKFQEEVSIKKVVFVQADIPDSSVLPPNPNGISFVNIYCPWDPALLASTLLNHYTPAGLTGWKLVSVRNKFVPLFGHWHLHISSIGRKQFAEFVAAL